MNTCVTRCFRHFFSGYQSAKLEENQHVDTEPAVTLDTDYQGTDVVIVKNGSRICGTGSALANTPIAQNKAYFEIKIQSSGVWSVGLATKRCNVNNSLLGNDRESWVLRHSGQLYHNGENRAVLPEEIQEGDIVGFSYDHVELNFFLNGKPLDTPLVGIKGTVFPVFNVDQGAILDIYFKTFFHRPPDGFDRIIMEKSLF